MGFSKNAKPLFLLRTAVSFSKDNRFFIIFCVAFYHHNCLFLLSATPIYLSVINRLFLFLIPVCERYCLMRTMIFTRTALNAFPVANSFDIHFALMYTSTAMCAFIFIYFNTEKRNRIKKRIQCTERTKKATKCTVAENTQQQHGSEHKYFPRKERSEHVAQRGIFDYQRYSALERSRRADILAKSGHAFDKRNANHKDCQHNIFQFREYPCYFAFF